MDGELECHDGFRRIDGMVGKGVGYGILGSDIVGGVMTVVVVRVGDEDGEATI